MNTLSHIDHLVYAVLDLAHGIDAIERMTGVRPQRGGSHPGLGTANALLSLGPDIYLEVIGPDPNQPDPPHPRPFGLDQLDAPRMATWAIKATPLEAQVQASKRGGYDPGAIRLGSRLQPDGTILAWHLALPPSLHTPCDGLIPFLIDWHGTAHPAANAPRGCTLLAFRAEHPTPTLPQAMLEALNAPLPLTLGALPRLIAVLQTPAGRVELT